MVDKRFGPQGWTPERLGNLVGKTYLITGANAGAGFQAARTLLTKGAKVVMLNRNAQKSTNAVNDLKEEFGANAEVSFVRMDLSDLASVRTAAEEVIKTVPRIDALICNAAIAQVHAYKRAPGVDQLYVSGEMEFKRRDEYTRDGIPLNDVTLNDIGAAAKELGVDTNEYSWLT